MRQIHGETPEEDGGERMARQALDQIRGHVIELDQALGEGVVTGHHLAADRNRDEGG